MSDLVVDTHTIVWYLSGDERLSTVATQALDECLAAGDVILIPSISLVEITYLVEKGRLDPSARERLIRTLDAPAAPCRLVPLDRTVANAILSVPRSEVPDLPDRIIAATAMALGCPLVSRDASMKGARIQIIW